MAGARTDEIATAAHANKAMLYYYFGNKRRLHRAVLKTIFGQLRSDVYRPRRETPRRDNGFARSFWVTSIFWRRIPTTRAWSNAKRWRKPAISIGSSANTCVRFIHSACAHDREGDCSRRASRGGSASHGIHDSRHDHFLLRGRANPERSRRHNLLAPNAIADRKSAVLDFIDHSLTPEHARSR